MPLRPLNSGSRIPNKADLLHEMHDEWRRRGHYPIRPGSETESLIDMVAEMTANTLQSLNNILTGNKVTVATPDPAPWNPNTLYPDIRGYDVPSPNKIRECNHNWKKYIGFKDSYMYCEHCPEKKDIPEDTGGH